MSNREAAACCASHTCQAAFEQVAYMWLTFCQVGSGCCGLCWLVLTCAAICPAGGHVGVHGP
jgi:hypothetical protein